jgi:hypothetical protein
VRATQTARTGHLAAYSLIPDATWFRRRDILPPRSVSVKTSSFLTEWPPLLRESGVKRTWPNRAGRSQFVGHREVLRPQCNRCLVLKECPAAQPQTSRNGDRTRLRQVEKRCFKVSAIIAHLLLPQAFPLHAKARLSPWSSKFQGR